MVKSHAVGSFAPSLELVVLGGAQYGCLCSTTGGNEIILYGKIELILFQDFLYTGCLACVRVICFSTDVLHMFIPFPRVMSFPRCMRFPAGHPMHGVVNVGISGSECSGWRETGPFVNGGSTRYFQCRLSFRRDRKLLNAPERTRVFAHP